MAKDSSYNSFKEYPGPVKRQDAFPLDLTYIHSSLTAAQDYAKNDPSAYVGQLLCAMNGNTPIVMKIINKAGALVQMASLPDVNYLIDQQIKSLSAAVTYRGSIFVNVENSDYLYQQDVIHAPMSRLLEANGGITPQIGYMYNLNMDNEVRTRVLHLIDAISVATSTDTGLCQFAKCTQEDNEYYVYLYIDDSFADAYPPPANGCANMFAAYNGGTADGSMKYCFTELQEWTQLTYGTGEEAEERKAIKLHLVNEPDDSDEYSKELINNPKLLSPDPTNYPNIAKFVTPQELYTFITNATANNNVLQQAQLNYTMQLRNGDNLVYNGVMWDDMSGPIDLSQFVTKEELSSDSCVFRYREG